MRTVRITCDCGEPAWDVAIDAAKELSLEKHNLYQMNCKDAEGQRRGEEDSDFKCSGCGKTAGLLSEAI